MLERFRHALVIPVCLLVASPLFVLTITAQSNFEKTSSGKQATPGSQACSGLIGCPASVTGDAQISEPVKMALIPSLFSTTTLNAPSRLIWTFRGINGRGADTWRFDQVLGRREIQLKSDMYEMMNVELSAQAVDNSVIMPGDTFSFNNEVGVRSEEKGYKAGLMFQQGQVVRGVGGGICIVSTGMYHAALQAGLKIIERSSHSGIPRYTEPGFDAAVAYGSLDLKIKNDTKTPVMLRAEIDGDILAITFLGRKTPGVTVELAAVDAKEIPFKIFEKPDPSIPEGELKVVQKAKTGLEITTIRLFKKDGKVIEREVIGQSRYLPRNKIILIPVPPETPELEQAAAQTERPEPALEKPAADAKPAGTQVKQEAKPHEGKALIKEPAPKKWEIKSPDNETDKQLEQKALSLPGRPSNVHPSDDSEANALSPR